jgi:succinate-acetate transporter protein
MKNELNTAHVKIMVADPSPIGLFGLALVTIVASSQKLGWTGGLAYVLPAAIFLGAIAQLIASITDFKHNNIFGATAFGAYGLFWLLMAMSWIIQVGLMGKTLQEAADPRQLGMVFLGFLVLSLFLTVAALEVHKVMLIIFIFIDLLFLTLTLSSFGIAYHTTHTLAGIAELLTAIFSFYGCGASLLNGFLGRTVLPVGKPMGILKKAA